MNKKEYNELLKKYYTENNSNIEKWIFIVTTGAISLLLGFSDKITNLIIYFFYVISIILFLSTLFLQLYSARISKEGCDYGLDEKGEFNDKSVKCFEKSEKINTTFFITFIIAIIFSAIMILINNSPIMTKNRTYDAISYICSKDKCQITLTNNIIEKGRNK